MLITLSIIMLFHLEHGSWALVSVVMVMGGLPHIGGVVEKGLQRLAGTIIGGLFGIIALQIPFLREVHFPDAPIPFLQEFHFLPLLMVLSVGLASYLSFSSRYSYSVSMFNITIVMVLGDGTLDTSVAVWRSCNVLIGTSAAILTSVIIQPQKATDVMRFMLAGNLDRLARVYRIHTRTGAYDPNYTSKLMKEAGTRLVKQRALIEAVHREGRIKRGTFNDILSLQRRMISTVELLIETHWDTRDGHDLIEGLSGLREQQRKLAGALSTLAYEIRTGQLIYIDIASFDLEPYAETALNAHSDSGKALFSPSGYLWLNRELSQQTSALVATLSNIQRLPSRRLRKRASHGYVLSD